MSSIRPLATITVLAFVGVFLYLKINETEPVLPAGVDSWSVEADIQIGDGFGGSTAVATTGAPGTTPLAAGNAPPFSPGSTTGSLASASPSIGAPPVNPSPNTASSSEAPSWSPEQAASVSPNPVDAVPVGNQRQPAVTDVAAASLELPPLPELPVTTAGPSADPHSVPSLMTPEVVQPPASAGAVPPVQAAADTPPADGAVANQAQAQSSLFAATRVAVQSALDRGELSQALLLLSDWYGDPSLSPSESQEVHTLLSQLAGSVIYSTEPRLEAPYMVQAGETLADVAKKYDVPWQLLAKINSIHHPDQLPAGQELKVVRGPFSAVVDLSQRKLTLMLDRRYAGAFPIEFEPSISIEEGQWTVNQKLLTPTAVGFDTAVSTAPSEDRSLTLASSGGATNQLAIIRGAAQNSPPAEPSHRVIRLKSGDVSDVFDILSLGSKVIIRR